MSEHGLHRDRDAAGVLRALLAPGQGRRLPGRDRHLERSEHRGSTAIEGIARRLRNLDQSHVPGVQLVPTGLVRRDYWGIDNQTH